MYVLLFCHVSKFLRPSHALEVDECLEKKQRKTTVRQTDVYKHHGSLIAGPPETPRISQHYSIEEFKGDLNSTPIIPRDARTADVSFSSLELSYVYHIILIFSQYKTLSSIIL